MTKPESNIDKLRRLAEERRVAREAGEESRKHEEAVERGAYTMMLDRADDVTGAIRTGVKEWLDANRDEVLGALADKLDDALRKGLQ